MGFSIIWNFFSYMVFLLEILEILDILQILEIGDIPDIKIDEIAEIQPDIDRHSSAATNSQRRKVPDFLITAKAKHAPSKKQPLDPTDHYFLEPYRR